MIGVNLTDVNKSNNGKRDDVSKFRCFFYYLSLF